MADSHRGRARTRTTSFFGSWPVQRQLLFLAVFLTLPALAIIGYTGVKERRDAFEHAAHETQKLADVIATEQETVTAAAQQLGSVIAELPDVKNGHPDRVGKVLAGIIRISPDFRAITILDRSGVPLVSTAQLRKQSFATERFFANAAASRRFSSGAYAPSSAAGHSVLTMGYPLSDAAGAFAGVIAIDLDLEKFAGHLRRYHFPPGANYILVDHRGTILNRGADNGQGVGAGTAPGVMERMAAAGESGTETFRRPVDGSLRITSFRKMRLDGEKEPYLYIRAGVPYQAALGRANRAIVHNLCVLALFVLMAFGAAVTVGKRSIVDRVAALNEVARELASGNLAVRVGDRVKGGGLGILGETFDEMAEQLAERDEEVHYQAKVLEQEIAERQGAEESLRVERNNLKAIFDSAPVGMALLNARGRVLSANRLMQEQMERGGARTAHARLGEALRCTHCEKPGSACGRELECAVCPLNGAIGKTASSGGEIRGEEIALEAVRDGVAQTVWIRFSMGPLLIDGERHLVFAFDDISRRKRGEEDLLRARKLESLGVLAGGIAHDFNNYLTAILGNVSMARMRLADDEIVPLLINAETASLRARDLTQQLLTFSRGGAPVTRLASMPQLITDSAGFVLSGSNVRCRYRFAEDLWPVEVDTGQMSQVINNLIVNAHQAMPEGGTIEIAAANEEPGPGGDLPAGRYLKIAIADQGVGIPEAVLPRIFDPYFTTKEQGNGLGLATVYSIVKNHHGAIRAQSAPGRGSTFTLYLPASAAAAPQEAAQGEVVAGQGTILVMDDEPLIREVAKRILEHLGYRATVCGDGEEACELYRKAADEGRRFDAVIMDITVPGGMGGKEVVRRISAWDPQLCAIVSSGYANDPVMARFSEYGFRGTLTKPYRVEEFGTVLSRVLQAAAG